MSDLRRDFENTLRKYGHNILLQRRINEYTDDDPTFASQLERHTTRHMHPGSRQLTGIAKSRMRELHTPQIWCTGSSGM
jgi:hypothetical protein